MKYKDFDGTIEELVRIKLKVYALSTCAPCIIIWVFIYVLRPLLACRWIEQKKCPPPVLFQKLVDEVLDEDMKPVVSDLLQKKVQMAEADKAPRIHALDDYIEDNLEHFKQLAASMADDRNDDWTALNKVFVQMLSRWSLCICFFFMSCTTSKFVTYNILNDR